MKKSILSGLVLISSLFSLWAGDVATFVDKGFSEDGKYYFFGQYGKTDKNFQGWAEIYQVDIAKNDYVDSGVFKTKPSAVTADKSGKDVYESLEAKSFYYLKNIPTKKADIDHTLYILDDPQKEGTEEIVFQDFLHSDVENPDTYHIQLNQTVNGSGKNCKSSFYIQLNKCDSEGNVITSKKIGTPSINRKGVTGYKIERIICDENNENFIFIVEKKMEDDTGVFIRYMVEAAEIF